MNRYQVIKNPPGRHRKGGYAIRDHRPHPIESEDIEGVGLVVYNQPKPGPSVTCWFKRKCDAQVHCDNLNKWDREQEEQLNQNLKG